MSCICVFQQVSVFVLVGIRFANTRKNIGNINTNIYFQELQYLGNTDNSIGNTEYCNINNYDTPW